MRTESIKQYKRLGRIAMVEAGAFDGRYKTKIMPTKKELKNKIKHKAKLFEGI